MTGIKGNRLQLEDSDNRSVIHKYVSGQKSDDMR